MNDTFQKLLIVSMISILFFTGCHSGKKATSKEAYIFSYFTDEDQGAGLHLAYSYDGMEWKTLNEGQPLFKPAVGNQKIMRDPSICQGPDGTFHLVWTVSWADKGIGYAHSFNTAEPLFIE